VKKIAVTYPVPQSIVRPGFEVEVVSPWHHGAYTAPYSMVDYKILELGNLEAGLRAEAAGADAFFLNSGGDYGIEDLRDNLQIPVIGGMQATMLLAANLGSRFSIVTIWPVEINHIHHRQLSMYGMESRCVSIRNVTRFDEVGTPDRHRTVVDRMLGRAADVIDRIVAEIERAAREDGAQSAVLGCTCMHPIAPVLDAKSSIPVIDGTTAGYGLAELMVRLGLRPTTPPRGSMLLARNLLSDVLATACSTNSVPDDACGDVCEALDAVAASQALP
jgi:Asp/Glu/hydantoin racemase